MRLSGFAPSPNGEGWGGVFYFVTLLHCYLEFGQFTRNTHSVARVKAV